MSEVAELKKYPKFHIIDPDTEGEEFSAEKLGVWFEGADLLARGMDFGVVSVLGCQSSGKSTLLNLLFATEFDTMEETDGRSQTTKGIWLGRSAYSPVLVMDVEGTDGRERGEDTNFERKSALFSLAVSQILIVNTWMHDIGRFQGANYPLLRTVFEQNLRLFSHTREGDDKKTLLLFVIRDHTSFTPLEALAKAIREDIAKIWGQIAKPEQFEESVADDFFDLDFVGLPPKPYQPEEFLEAAVKLRGRINRDMESEEPGFWKEKYISEVPVDGLTTYYDNVWGTVHSNKDLDIPTQLEMLATHRCDEFIETCFSNFTQSMQPIREQLEGKQELVEGFGAKVGGMMEEVLTKYDAQAKRYNAAIATKKRDNLVEKMSDFGGSSFRLQVELLRERESEKLDQALGAELGDGKVCDGFFEVVGKCEEASVGGFENGVKESMVSIEGVVWVYEKELGGFKRSVGEVIEKKRKEQVGLYGKEVEKEMKKVVGRTVERCLENPEENMWGKINEAVKEGETVVVGLGEKMKTALRSEEGEVAQFVEEGKAKVREGVVVLVKGKGKNQINYQMEKVFEQAFNYLEGGERRRWTPADNVDSLFKKALGRAAGVMDLFAIIRLEKDGEEREGSILDEGVEEKFDEEEFVLTRPEAKEILRKFRKEAEAERMKAVAQQEQEAAKGQMPYFWIILILIFATDEIYYVLTNPFMFMFFALLAGVGVAGHKMGFTPIVKKVLMEKFEELKNGQLGGPPQPQSSSASGKGKEKDE